MRSDSYCCVSQCDTCCRLKQRSGSRCGHLPLKDFNQETTTWDAVIVGSAGPWTFVDHSGKERTLTALNIIDPSNELFETFRTRNDTSF